MNAYLKSKRDKFDALRKTIEGFQTRAADEGRDLTEVELRSITEQSEQAKTLADEIESLTAIEARNAKVADLAGSLIPEQRTSSTTTQLRDPGHYRSEKQGGEHSFFADLVRAREDGDRDAVQRLEESHRALTSSSAGAGLLPPKWLVDEYAAAARQTRRVADRVHKINLGMDPRPLSLPKQTGLTSVGVQASEGATTTWSDAYTSSVDTVVPATIVGGQKVSRQLLDAGVPAVDELIYGDLIADYNTKVEARVVGAMVTAAGTATTAYASESAYTTAITPTSTGVPFLKDLRRCATSVRNLRKFPADIVIASVSRYTSWLDITDLQGRPLIPASDNQVVNAFGNGTVATDGRILGMEIIATDGITNQTYPESIVVARSADTLLFESGLLRFKYEQPDGPELIRLGVWGYVAALTRYAGASTQRLQVTAA